MPNPTPKLPNSTPSAAEFGQLRAFLAQSGVSQADIDKAVGTAAKGRTRAQIVRELIAWLLTLKKTVVVRNIKASSQVTKKTRKVSSG